MTFGGEYGSAHLCQQAGITYRQLNYWIDVGYIRPENPLGGSGWPVTFSRDEFGVAVIMGRLVGAGLIPSVAIRAARLIATGQSVTLAPGLTVTTTADFGKYSDISGAA